MRTYRLFLVFSAALTLAVSAGAARAQEPTPSPSPSPSASPSPQASASPSPTPTPTDPPAEPGDLSDLSVTVAPQGRLAQVGERLTYSVAVVNEGTATLEDVVVRQLVAAELTVVGVPVLDEVEAINLGRLGDQEDITWTLGDLEPGDRFVLPWFAEVERAGDLIAAGSLTLSAGEEERTMRPGANYLASVLGLRVTDEGQATVKRRVVSERRVTPPATAAGAPGALPATGPSSAVVVTIAALLLVATGSALLLSPRRRSRSLTLIAVLLMAACVGDGGNDRAAEPEVSPEVKGRVIERDDEEERREQEDNEDAREDATDDESAADEEGEEDEEAVDTPVAVDAPVPSTTQIVREVRIVRVPTDELPVTTLGATQSDNVISLDWSEADGVRTAGSSIRFGRGPVSLRTGISASGRRIQVEVTITNESADRLIEIDGRILHEISGLPGGKAALRSEPLSIVLAPGGETVETFVYTLPTGSYTLSSRFAPD